MAFNYSPKSSNEILSKNKQFSLQVAMLFDFVQGTYGVGISLDPNSNFKQVKVSRELEKKGTSIKDVIAGAKKAGIDTSQLTIKFGTGSADAKATVGSAISTAMQENASRLYFESYIEKGKFPPFSEVAKIYPEVDDSWIMTFELQSKALKEFLSNNRQYNYSRGDGFMKFVEDVAKSFGVRTIDTWNPADIYMVKKDKESDIRKQITIISDNHKSEKNLSPLNDLMKVYLKSKDLLPISLKKLAAKQQKAKLEISNVDKTVNKGMHKFGIGANSFGINFDLKSSNQFATTDGLVFRLTVDNNSVPFQMRNFPDTSPRTNSQIELTQFTGGARLGKVPADLVTGFIEANGMTRIRSKGIPQVGRWTDRQFDDYVVIYEELSRHTFMGTKVKWGESVDTSAKFKSALKKYIIIEQSNDKFASHFSSKLQGMHLVHNMMMLDKMEKLEEFLSILFYGAKKELGAAGPFIKIY